MNAHRLFPLSAATLLIAVVILSVTQAVVAQSVPQPRQSQQDLPTEASGNWYSRVQQQLAEEEYQIRWQPKHGTYSSPNRAQNLRTRYHYDGFSVEPRVDSLEGWSLRLRIAEISKGGSDMLNPRKSVGREGAMGVCVSGGQMTQDHDGFQVQYQNDGEGMRQNIVVDRRPEGSGLLRVRMEVSGSLAVKSASGNRAEFADRSGMVQATYDGLSVWDAKGQVLSSRLVKSGNELVIEVEDGRAEYPVMIDPLVMGGLSDTADWVAEGDQENAHFGSSVSSAGDVNGDGYSDVIVGATGYDNGEENEGRVYVYYGSSSGLSNTASWIAEGNQTESYFGSSVSNAGDVNGDGYSDVIVGATGYDNGEENEGRTYVYHGSKNGLSVTPAWTAEGNQVEAYFGFSVSSAGDVNGDGYSDVTVGAHGYDNGDIDEGRAYVYHGSSSGLSPIASWNSEGNQARAYFGFSVSSAGDINGDGYSDVIVGAPNYDHGESNEGRASVYYGSASGLPTTASWSAEGNNASAGFGYSVSTAGDVNGDGYSDVIVGAPNYDHGESNEGRASVYYGSASGLPTTASWSAEGNQALSYFGFSGSSAGDINGDGYSDVIVGAYQYDNGEPDRGNAYVYYGSDVGLLQGASWSAEGNQALAYFGISVSSAGDVNGDGYSDVIIGAEGSDKGETNKGQGYVYYGSGIGLSATLSWTFEGNQGHAQLGWSVCCAGDVNNDGFSDIIIGALLYDNGQDNEGGVFVYYGSVRGLSSTPSWTAEGGQKYALFGLCISRAGDVNGDSYDDIVIGTPHYDNTKTDQGRVYVYYGSESGLSVTQAWIAEGNHEENQFFGISVSSAGDVNSDGYSDIIIGAAGYDNAKGQVSIYYGSANGLSNIPAWIVQGDQSAYLGHSVSDAGDVNGDSYSDVIISASSGSNGENYEGRVFVYYGSETGLSLIPAWVTEGNQVAAYFGSSVSSAGDVNGDGYSDVIIGARLYDNEETNEGRVFVYYGSANGLSFTPSWTAEGKQKDAEFGYRVSNANDVNGDGYNDIIIGADHYDNEEIDAGRAYIYYGSKSGLLTTPAWIAEGNQEGARLGHSVSSAGDVNGDGYSDIIIGADLYDKGETDEGRVFLYYGNSSNGMRTTPTQHRPDFSAPVVSALSTYSRSEVGLQLFGRTSFDRADVKVQFEVKPIGTSFDGNNLVETVDWTNIGTSGVTIQKVISGLKDSALYRWRARLKYRLNNGAVQSYSRWYTPSANNVTEADFRVGIPTQTTSVAVDPQRDKRKVAIEVVPNVSHDDIVEVKVHLPESIIGGAQVQVYDVQGHQVLDGQLIDRYTDRLQLDVRRLPSGQYLVRLSVGSQLSAETSFMVVR